MVALLYACLNGDCLTYFFRTPTGECPSCETPGTPVMWAVKPPRPS
jgi:hypothetical protein